jgi:hypothetical protein
MPPVTGCLFAHPNKLVHFRGEFSETFLKSGKALVERTIVEIADSRNWQVMEYGSDNS